MKLFLWEGFSIMTKQRLKIVQRHLFEQLDKLDFSSSTKAAKQVAEVL